MQGDARDMTRPNPAPTRARCRASGDRTAPVLVIGIGNPSRGDDALGPVLISRLQQWQDAGWLEDVELLNDFQLQIEHVLDLADRERVIVVDAAASLDAPYRLLPISTETMDSGSTPAAVLGWTTHRLAPNALLALYRSLHGEPPPLDLLAIGGCSFELGAALSAKAAANLEVATEWLLFELQCLPTCTAHQP